MSEYSSMVASAVIVPEALEEELFTTSSGALKRRKSSVSEDNSKRPRLSPQTEESPSTRPADARSPILDKSSDSTRRLSKTGKQNERDRGRRLFGAVLGTLSQSSSSVAQKRRAEIEKKQQDKLRLQAEEDDQNKRRRLEDLTATRRAEQKTYDGQSTRLRHSNTLAMSHFLQTITEPRLYYKPWKNRPQEEEQIKRQIQEAEALIEEESSNNVLRIDKIDTQPELPANVPQLDGTEDLTTSLERTASVGLAASDADSYLAVTNVDTNHTDHPNEPKIHAEQVKELGEENEEMIVESGEDAVIY